MKIGLQINRFAYSGGTPAIGPTLARIVRSADDAGFDSLWVMDHFFQIRGIGPAEDPMLEGWTTLGFIAAHTSHARLGLMVGGIHYRLPGLWVKAATTLDVLSGGRAWLGIGAAWNQVEGDEIGSPIPHLRARRARRAETCTARTARRDGAAGDATHGGGNSREPDCPEVGSPPGGWDGVPGQPSGDLHGHRARNRGAGDARAALRDPQPGAAQDAVRHGAGDRGLPARRPQLHLQPGCHECRLRRAQRW